MFITRNFMLRPSYQTIIEKIIETSPLLQRGDFQFIRQSYYITVNYKKRTIAVISDLNQATELKYSSNFLKDFPIMIYDEFLALEGDYLYDEWERLKTLYESIDRDSERSLIYAPKIFYLGNAVNFSSPVLSKLDLFNKMENHPINTVKQYGNILLEMNRNDNANEEKNTRAFSSENDSMTSWEFKTNSHNVATENDRNRVKRNARYIYVKLENDYLRVMYNADTYETILSIVGFMDGDYTFNTQLKDNKEDSFYLKESYYNDNHKKRYNRGVYLFDNNYSRDYITSEYNQINQLKINKLIKQFEQMNRSASDFDIREHQYQESYIEKSKRGLLKKFWG